MGELKNNEQILLMGNPNVGKSVFFTQLSGVNAVSSNYAGTTVGIMEGPFKLDGLDGKEYKIIDVPGIYSLTPTSEAETIAAAFLNGGARAIICVLDSSNLERNLCLALELQRFNIPTIYVLNLLDVAERRGITINVGLLEQELRAPVVSTIAVKNQGMDTLREKLKYILKSEETTACKACRSCDNCGQNTAREIARRVIKQNKVEENFLDKLGDSMMKPFPGLPIAVLAIGLIIGVVVGGGELLRELLLLPLVNDFIVPFFRNLFSSFLSEGVALNILVGEFGIFVISFEWIVALILPYVFLFYVGFSFLEDSGYLPRLSVLFDNIMRKIGVQGGSLLYAVMGLGCAVPAIIGSRAATTRKERIVISTAICFAVPCISQTGALISLTAAYDWWLLPALLVLCLFLFVTSALIAGKLVKGRVEPLLFEIPNLLLPEPKAYGRKLLIRMKHFLIEAEFPMMFAIIIAAVLKETGALETIAVYAEPLVSQWLGLPPEAVMGLILGIIRREMAVAPLLELGLTPKQAFIGAAVSLMYLPCLSVFAILTKEFKVRIALTITLSTVFTAIFFGGVINQLPFAA